MLKIGLVVVLLFGLCDCKDILDMLWNEGQIVAEYVQSDVVSRESMYGQHVAMTADATKLIVSAPGSCEVFLYTPISFAADNQSKDLTVRETVNNALGSNSNLKNHTFQVSQWNGLLLGPVDLPSYAYPPFYARNPDSAIDDGRNAPNSNPKNTDALNRQRASEENPTMWKRSSAVLRPPTGSPLISLAECKAANFGGKFHGTTGGNPLSIIDYDGMVSLGNMTIRVATLAAVGASDERTGDGAVYVFGQAQPTDRHKLPAVLDVGDGWFYQSKLTNHVKLPANKRAYMGYSVAMAYTAGSNAGVTLLASGRGLNQVLSFFLSSNGTTSHLDGIRDGKNYSWVADAPLNRNVEEKQSDTDRFGDALHMSVLPRGEGLVAAIGAPSYAGGIGRAYVFRLGLNPQRRWTQQAELLPEGPNPEPRPGNLFGYSIAISGDHVAVGMCAGTDPKQSAGVVHIFKFQAESTDYSLQDRLTPSLRSGGDDFGCSLAMVRTKVPIVNPVDVLNRVGNEDYYKTVVFVGAWNSMASATGSGAGKARKGAIHTFVTRASNLKIDDGYVWKEGPLLAMFERGGDAYWDSDQQNENNVPSHFGRSIAVSANAKDLIVGHAREDVFSGLPNIYNENPGMMLYFHDKFVDGFEIDYALMAVNSFAILLSLLLIAGCCSLCMGTFLRKSRKVRIEFQRLSIGGGRYDLSDIDGSNHKSLLSNESENQSDSEDDGDQATTLDILEGGFVAKNPKSDHGEVHFSDLHRPASGFPQAQVRVGNRSENPKFKGNVNLREVDSADTRSTHVFGQSRNQASSTGDTMEGANGSADVSSRSPVPSKNVGTQKLPRNRAAPMTSKKVNDNTGTIINIQARAIIPDLLLALSLSVCTYAFLYILFFRGVTSIFWSMLAAQVILGFLPGVVVVMDMFYPLWIRECVPVLWSGLETSHLVLRSEDNCDSVYFRQTDFMSLDAKSQASYSFFLWSSLTKSECLVVMLSLLGGGGALISTLRFLPWRQTLFSVYASGYPTLSVLKYAEYPTSLLYIAYACVLAIALFGSRPNDAAFRSEADTATSLNIPGPSNQLLSSLSFNLRAVDMNDWALQRAGYSPQHLDIVSSGGWLAITFLGLCCLHLTRSFGRFIFPVWMKSGGKWECFLHTIRICTSILCCRSSAGSIQPSESQRSPPSYRQMLNDDDDDDYVNENDDNGVDGYSGERMFGLEAEERGNEDGDAWRTGMHSSKDSGGRDDSLDRSVELELVELRDTRDRNVNLRERVSDADRDALHRETTLRQQRLLRPRMQKIDATSSIREA